MKAPQVYWLERISPPRSFEPAMKAPQVNYKRISPPRSFDPTMKAPQVNYWRISPPRSFDPTMSAPQVNYWKISPPRSFEPAMKAPQACSPPTGLDPNLRPLQTMLKTKYTSVLLYLRGGSPRGSTRGGGGSTGSLIRGSPCMKCGSVDPCDPIPVLRNAFSVIR